jgi:hypothetical protein
LISGPQGSGRRALAEGYATEVVPPEVLAEGRGVVRVDPEKLGVTRADMKPCFDPLFKDKSARKKGTKPSRVVIVEGVSRVGEATVHCLTRAPRRS